MIDILLIEPDKVLGRTYRGALQAAGYSVAVQTSAQGAIHSVDKQRPKLIVLELQLTKHNGVEFLYELRSYADWQRIPVIILSHIPAEEAGLSDALQQKLEISAYCYKPQTRLQDLVDKTKNCLQLA